MKIYRFRLLTTASVQSHRRNCNCQLVTWHFKLCTLATTPTWGVGDNYDLATTLPKSGPPRGGRDDENPLKGAWLRGWLPVIMAGLNDGWEDNWTAWNVSKTFMTGKWCENWFLSSLDWFYDFWLLCKRLERLTNGLKTVIANWKEITLYRVFRNSFPMHDGQDKQQIAGKYLCQRRSQIVKWTRFRKWQCKQQVCTLFQPKDMRLQKRW